MLWLLLTRLLLVASLVAWWVKKPNSYLQTLLLCIATALTFYVVSPLYAALAFTSSLRYSRELAWYFRLDDLLLRHASMIITLAAVSW